MMTKEQYEGLPSLIRAMTLKTYDNLTEMDRTRITFAVDALWYLRQKERGEFTPEESAFKPTKDQTDAVYSALLTLQ